MNEDIAYQVTVFLLCCVFGIAIALLFDGFRVSRRFVKTGVLLTFLEDTLFWLLSAVLFFVFILKFYNGEFRVFMVFGILLGAIIYFNTLSALFIRVSVILIGFFRAVIRKLLTVLLMPLRLIIKLLNKPVFIAINFGKKSLYGIGRRLSFNLNVFKKFGIKPKHSAKK